MLKSGATASTGEPILQVAYGQLNALNLNFQPVYGFDRDDVNWPLVLSQGKASGGMLLRLDLDDLEFMDDTFDRIQDLTLRGLDTRQMDVMVDLRGLSVNSSLSAAESTAQFLDSLSTSFNVRNTIVAGSSAPKTVAEIPKNSNLGIYRNELNVWANLRARNLPLEVTFGDYGVIHPDFTDLTPSPHINGKIRYTKGKHIHIFRGHSLRLDDKYEQYRKLAHSVMNSGHYEGHKFSTGDRFIYDCASGQASTGSPGTWVFNDQNHHFTYSISQMIRLEKLVYRGYSGDAIMELA
jgi:hypothetical protein